MRGGSLAILIALSYALNGWAQDADHPVAITGSVAALAGNGAYQDQPSESFAGLRLRLDASAKARGVSARLRTAFASNSDLADSGGSSHLREAWIRYSGRTADVTLGRQLISTGRSDIIVLQDQFAPRDLTEIAMTDQEQRLGVSALRLDWFPLNELTLTAALLRQDRSYVLPSHSRAQLPAWEPLSKDPEEGLLVRADYRKGSLELGIAFMRGASPLPGISIAEGQVSVVNPKEQRFALDGSYSVGGGVFRWDIVRAETFAADLPGYSARRWALSVGWDQGLWADANLSIQTISRRDTLSRPDLAGDPTVTPLFSVNRRLSQAFDTRQSWETATLKQRVRDEHDLEVGILVGSQRQRGVLHRWVWRPRDGWSFQLRAQVVKGDLDSLVASTSYERLAFGEVRYQF